MAWHAVRHQILVDNERLEQIVRDHFADVDNCSARDVGGCSWRDNNDRIEQRTQIKNLISLFSFHLNAVVENYQDDAAVMKSRIQIWKV